MSENNYNNFNGYQQPPVQPGQPIQQAAQPVFPMQQSADAANKKSANTMGIVSLVLAPLSCCCCGVPSLVGIGLSIAGLVKSKGNVLCIIGLILNILVLGYLIISMGTAFTNPAFAEYMEAVANANGDPEAIEQAAQQFMQGYGLQ